MKLIVQIPCYNEADALPAVVADIPRQIPGIDELEVLVVDDGSTDGTSAVAEDCGVDHIVRHLSNRGLAAAYRTGLDACLSRGADIIVNTDGDGQYRGECIPKLIELILKGEYEVVVGERPIETIEHFSPLNKRLHRLGSRVVEKLSGVRVPDATSGFRAITRRVAMGVSISSRFTYTLETLIAYGDRGIAVGSVPIRTRKQTRPSRLFRNSAHYVWLSAWDILRITTWHAPLRLFWTVGSLLMLPGLALAVRFLYFFFTDGGAGHVQSLLFGAVLVVVGFQVALTGLVADMNAVNRRRLEEVLQRLRQHDAQ